MMGESAMLPEGDGDGTRGGDGVDVEEYCAVVAGWVDGNGGGEGGEGWDSGVSGVGPVGGELGEGSVDLGGPVLGEGARDALEGVEIAAGAG